MPNNYEKLARIYTRLVRGYSPSAAAELEKIHTCYGARAAYYAALGLSLLIRKVKRQGWNHSSEPYPFHLADVPEAMPLYLKAVDSLSNDMGKNVSPREAHEGES